MVTIILTLTESQKWHSHNHERLTHKDFSYKHAPGWGPRSTLSCNLTGWKSTYPLSNGPGSQFLSLSLWFPFPSSIEHLACFLIILYCSLTTSFIPLKKMCCWPFFSKSKCDHCLKFRMQRYSSLKTEYNVITWTRDARDISGHSIWVFCIYRVGSNGLLELPFLFVFVSRL